MNHLERIINSPEQKSAEFWQRASEIMTEHTDQLERLRTINEEEFLVTPPFTPGKNLSLRDPSSSYNNFRVSAIQGATKSEDKILGNSFSIATQVDKGKKYRPGDPLYLIINEQITAPLLQFDRGVTRLMVLDGSFGTLDDSDRIVTHILDYVDEAMDAQQKSNEAVQYTSRRKYRVAGGILLSLATIGGGIYTFKEWREGLAEKKVATRAAFDAQNFDLETPAVEAGETSFVDTKSILFLKNVPKRNGNEALDNPRRFSVFEGSCEEVETLDPSTESVRVVTSAPAEQVYVAVNSDGRVQVCSFETREDTDEEAESKFDVAVQVVPRQKL